MEMLRVADSEVVDARSSLPRLWGAAVVWLLHVRFGVVSSTPVRRAVALNQMKSAIGRAMLSSFALYVATVDDLMIFLCDFLSVSGVAQQMGDELGP